MRWAYSATMFGAILTGVLLTLRARRPLPLPGWQRAGIACGGFCGAMIGAKVPFVLSDWEGFSSGLAWFSDGKTILAGLVGGYIGVEAAKWSLDVRVKTGDTFVVPVSGAIAVGRLACFVGGCCFGAACDLPWGVDFGDGVRRHPTQLYEFAFHLSAAVFCDVALRRGWFKGQLVKLYILAYLAYRFLTEFIRPEPVWLAGLTSYQWACLALAPVFLFLWRRDVSERNPPALRPRLESVQSAGRA